MNDWHAFQRVNFEELLLRQVKVYRENGSGVPDQRELIPRGRLVEIRYEALEQDKLGQIRQLYANLELDGYDSFAPHLSQYVASIADFQKNPSHINNQVIELVTSMCLSSYRNTVPTNGSKGPSQPRTKPPPWAVIISSGPPAGASRIPGRRSTQITHSKLTHSKLTHRRQPMNQNVADFWSATRSILDERRSALPSPNARNAVAASMKPGT